MARSLNRASLIGNVGADPEIRTLPGGAKVANLRIATSESWKDRNTGERREATEWHTVQIFGDALIDGVIAPYVKKGSRVMAEGMIRTRKWQDQQGNDRYSTEISIAPYRGQLILLDRPNAGGAGSGASGGPPPGDMGGRPDFDDEIPF